MKMIKLSQAKMMGGYCYGCGTQCQNDCGYQHAGRVAVTVEKDALRIDATAMDAQAVRK